MDAKTFLNQIALYDAHINSKIEELDRLKALRLKVTATLKADVVSHSGNADKIGDATAKIIDLERELNADIDAYVDKKREIEAVIQCIKDADQVNVIRKRYMLNEPWEQIAYELHCSLRHATRIHGYALKSVEKLLKNKSCL